MVDGPLITSDEWPNHHAWDNFDIELLELALNERDWSHSRLACRFEAEFAAFIGVRHAMMVPSGTFAVQLALVSLGIKPGHEVIVPGITWPSVIYAILATGGVPVTVDINPNSLCMDPVLVEGAIGPKTFAILATHLFGSQADMGELSEIADRNNLFIVEDAAQTVGSSQSNKRCGAWGTIGAFSLNDRKLLACGEGGVIVTDDDALIHDLRQQQLILPERGETVRATPGTFKVSEFQAAIAIAQLAKLERRLNTIRKNVEILERYVRDIPNCIVQERPTSCTEQSYYNFCLLYDGKGSVQAIRQNLSRALKINVSAPYLPISDISDFDGSRQPVPKQSILNIKRRHKNCMDAYNNRAIRLPHNVLLAEEDVMHKVGTILSLHLSEL